MEIDIITQKENKALDRTEVKFDCAYSGEPTPKLLDVKNKLIALLDAKKELIVVDSIQPHFGEAKAVGYAKIYDSVESLNSIETEHVISKNIEVKESADESEEETPEAPEAPEASEVPEVPEASENDENSSENDEETE